MSPELKDLLDDAARAPRRPVDVDDIHRRARRSRATELVAGVAALALLAGGVAFGVTRLADERAPAPFISQAPTATPSAPATATPGPDQQGVVTAGHLDADVFLAVDASDAGAGDAHVLKIFPDGSTYTMPVETLAPSRARMHVDDRGGFVYQEPMDAGGSAAIREVGLSGVTETRVPASPAGSDTWVLVGAAEGASLVAHSTGTTPDDTTVELLEVGHLGAGTRVVASNVAAWESAVMSAASLEVTVYVLAELSGTSIVVAPPDGPPTVVWRGGEDSGGASGEEAIDVEIVGDTALALVRTPDGAQLLTIDLFAPEPAVVALRPVPLDLGVDGGSVVVTELTGHEDHVAVNRHTDDGWLPALVVEVPTPVDSGAELPAWQVFERPGRILLGRPVPGDSVASPPCASADDARNAPPSGEALYLYAACSGDVEPWNAYRLDTGEQRTGDVESDAGRVLELLFGGLSPERRDEGYRVLTRDPFSDGSGLRPISVAGVTFDAGTLVVDFSFPDGVGIYSASHARTTFHTLLAANLLQLPDVQVVELHESGGCERYPRFFEGDGCVRLTAAGDAPWNGQRVFD